MAGLDVKVSQLGEVVVASDNDLLNLVTYDEQNQTYISGKVKASTMKDYMIGDTDISELGDGTPTGAIDTLDGKIDDNYDEWKEQWKKNGAYNLLPMTYTNHVINGATAIVNADGSVTIDTAGSATTGVANFVWDFPSFGKVGAKYKLVGCPSGGGANTYYVNIYDNGWSDNTKDYGSGKEITIGTGITQAVISIRSGVTIDHLTFKPMITTDLNATYDDFVPHAMTNGELTEEILGGKIYNFGTSDAGTNVTFLKAQAIKMGDIVFFTGSWVGNNTNAQPILTVPTDLRPKKSGYVVGAGSGERNDDSMSISGQYILNSSGALSHSLSTISFKEGSFTFIYSISKS